MKRFFTKTGIWLLAGAALIAVVLCIISALGSGTSLLHNALGVIASPFRAAGSAVVEWVGGIGDHFASIEELQAENEALRQDNAGATKEKQRHLENQILPGIAAYETLQTVMPKDEALETIHSYVEQKARRQKKLFLRLMRIPGLYKKVPGIFSEQTPKLFGVTAGFASRDIQTTGGVWRIDMTKCPYHDASVHYGCPELCHCFCDSDDITYDGLHPKLYWHRTKTLGRGGDCCDFCLKLRDK